MYVIYAMCNIQCEMHFRHAMFVSHVVHCRQAVYVMYGLYGGRVHQVCCACMLCNYVHNLRVCVYYVCCMFCML